MLRTDSRRLTGPSLLLAVPGAILDIDTAGADAAAQDALTAAWEARVRAAMDALGWPAPALASRRFAGGLSLACSAPLDRLYTATEVNEWAFDGAPGATAEAPAPPLADALEALRAAEAREANPGLLVLADAARRLDLRLLADDAKVTVGEGRYGLTWPARELPAPSETPWNALADIPTALVTGSNGKTTTVRLLAAMARAAGRVTGHTSTDAIVVGTEVVDEGDWAGPGGARLLLRDARVELAVLETARGGILRRGLAVDRADVAVITNIAADHFGEFGIADLESLADVKWVVTRAVRDGGRIVLNADDPHLVARGRRRRGQVLWFSLDAANPVLSDPRSAGAGAVVAEDGALVLRDGTRRTVVERLDRIPITFGGGASHNVANAAAATAAAHALGLPLAAIAEALRQFGTAERDNPGRANLLELGGVRVLVDFAHNPHGMDALVRAARALPAARRLVVLGQAGDRDDDAIRGLARSAWALRPDRVLCKELEKYRRGRALGEVPGLLAAEFRALGLPEAAIGFAADELDATRQALRWAAAGDLLVLAIHANRPGVMTLLGRLRAAGWTPGQPVSDEA
ncbi:MAG: Mur ligase family protein [Gemmatimonadales bacterium]|nr:Mur ligase family protein [Gemmatimonadales bacterium]